MARQPLNSPGDFSGAAAQAPSPQVSRPWHTWAEVTTRVDQLRTFAPFFLEIFAGTARLTQHVCLLGLPVLPPVDIEISEWVPVAQDILDATFWDQLLIFAHAGVLFLVHLGTPYNTFSSARKLDNGPPPLRSRACPLGLPDLSPDNQALVFLGNMFLHRSVELAGAVFLAGGNFSIENPLLSLIYRLHHQCIGWQPKLAPSTWTWISVFLGLRR